MVCFDGMARKLKNTSTMKLVAIGLLFSSDSYAGFSMRVPTGVKLTDLVAHYDVIKANSTTNAAYASGTGCVSNTTWHDIKGNHNGTLVNFDTCTTTGWLNSPNRLSKDSTNDTVTVTDHDNLSFTNGSGVDRPFSLEVWVNATDQAANRTIISKMLDTNNAEYVLYLQADETLRADLVGTDWNTTRIRFTTTAALSTGAWNQVVMTYDGSETAAGIKIYVNGALMAGTTSSTGSYTGMANTTGSVNIGSWDGSSFRMAGSLAIIRIYKVELTQAQVRRNCRMQAGRYSITCT
jgi:hypothetical protein